MESLLFAAQSSVTLWCGHEGFQCKSSPQCLLGLLKTPLGPAPPGAMPDQGDGALGLFTLRHIITERWIRSYLRSAFSQSSLATQPPRYKYTPETCTGSYSESRPSEPRGRYRQGARTSGNPQDTMECQPCHFKVKYGTHQIKRL
ncbi:Hypothetical predicted protein [Lynx pardinus]|uniref:Uncharacterized protein n=1 Tax=Lynx pardinus TaxID=191816 RepID=A0A485P9Q6_LYNPA|nr:Hypothetical predicted protein [Lynx pardinus]